MKNEEKERREERGEGGGERERGGPRGREKEGERKRLRDLTEFPDKFGIKIYRGER